VDKINFDIELMARLGQTDGNAITIGLSCSRIHAAMLC